MQRNAIQFSIFRHPAAQFLVVAGVAAVVLLTGLGSSRLWDRDEPRNAGCAAEMMARGDWVVPMFNDELRPQKPVLLYWLIMGSYALFGQNEFAARFPSALLGLGTVLVTWRIGCRLGNPRVGMLAAIVLATSLMFQVASRAATPDATLIFLSTLAIGIYVHAVFGKPQQDWFPRSTWTVWSMYAVLALGVLAKGPVGLIVPMAVIGMFLLIQRLPRQDVQASETSRSLARRFLCLAGRWLSPFHPGHFFRTLMTMKPWIAVVATLVIAGPWYVMVGMRTDGDFLWQFFWTENIGRATTSFENHSGGVWYYPLAIMLGFFPWSVLTLPIAMQLRSDFRQPGGGLPPGIVLLFCWIGVQVGLFTLASTKLPSYVTPCYPALALLVGIGLDRWLAGASRVADGWFAFATSGMVTCGLVVLAGLYFVGERILDGDLRVVWAAIPLIIGGGVTTWLALNHRRQLAASTMIPTAALFGLALFVMGAGVVDEHRQTERLWAAADQLNSDSPLAAFRCLESSWVFYAGRPIYELEPDRSRAAKRLDRANPWHQKPRVSPDSFAVDGQAMILTTDEHVDELEALLGGPVEVVESAPFFLKPERQLLLVRPSQSSATASRKMNSAPR